MWKDLREVQSHHHHIFTISGSTVAAEPDVAADPNNMTEEERVAEMGRPRLGDVPRIEVNITESEDFRVS